MSSARNIVLAILLSALASFAPPEAAAQTQARGALLAASDGAGRGVAARGGGARRPPRHRGEHRG